MMFDVISLILDVANQDNDAKGTSSPIMYRALFNHPRLKEFWNALIINGLLEFDLQTRTVKTAGRGLVLLQAYEKMDHHVIKKRVSHHCLHKHLDQAR